MRKLLVSFGPHVLRFSLESSPIATLWLERMEQRHRWPLDDARRFYNFGSLPQDEQAAEAQIRHCIETINQHQAIIQREFTSVHDQDLTNYLHNIFERYHGMLDRQDHEFWLGAPDTVRRALADLNIAVHRCESLRDREPRAVCTWFGMPKTQHLSLELQTQYGQLGCDFGGVYLNYVEIGKTARDLAHDDDHYIADEMFQPFDRYSADFVMTFFDRTPEQEHVTLEMIERYWKQHRDFFQKHGIQSHRDTRMLPLRFKVAQLDYNPAQRSAILDMISLNQEITAVEIT